MPSPTDKIQRLTANRDCLDGVLQEDTRNPAHVREKVVAALSEEELEWVRRVASGEVSERTAVRANAISLLGFDRQHAAKHTDLLERLALGSDVALALRAVRAAANLGGGAALLSRVAREGHVAVGLAACRALAKTETAATHAALTTLKSRLAQLNLDPNGVSVRSIESLLERAK
jgi:hypothetical protein